LATSATKARSARSYERTSWGEEEVGGNETRGKEEVGVGEEQTDEETIDQDVRAQAVTTRDLELTLE